MFPSVHSILYIGSLDPSSNSFMRFKTLQRMGFNVHGLDVDPYIFGTIWVRFHYHLCFGPGIASLNRELIKQLAEFKPDLIWVDNKPFVKSSTLKQIKNQYPKTKIINVITDDPFGKFYYSWRSIYKTFKYYDCHFVQREENISELKKWGANRVETCFRSFDPNFHRVLNSEEFDLSNYKSEIGFIGSYEEEREEYITYLVQNGIKLTITGDGWPSGKYWNILKEYYTGPSVYGDEYIKRINGMEIALHFLRKANRDQQDSRTFEIPACRTFMLAERSHLHLNFFEEGKEADYFTSKEELLKKIKYYLINKAERDRIAFEGYKRSYASGYDHESRLKHVIDCTKSEKKAPKKIKRIVVCIYIDPDFYPPTINAIINLSKICEELIVVTRNHAKQDFPYPGNVKLLKLGKQISVLETEKVSIVKKIMSFIRFTLLVAKEGINKKTDIIVLYDAIPLLSFYIFKKALNKKTIWYHNHDMPNTHYVRKYSVGWFANRYEHQAMKEVNLFTLPSDDRLAFYPNWKSMEHYINIPNYPSLNVYKSAISNKNQFDEIRIIFQGTIGNENAIEELINLLNDKIQGKGLRLILKGSVRLNYKKKLSELAELKGVSDRVEWLGLGPYFELPALTSTCHIGIAIYMGNDNVRKTLGTASNKIYEYAASGLPVILYDNAQFRKYLDNYDWTFFTDGSVTSLKAIIQEIVLNYSKISGSSRDSFESGLNFENKFNQVTSYLNASIK